MLAAACETHCCLSLSAHSCPHCPAAWLDVYLSHIPHIVYQIDDPLDIPGAQHATLADKGACLHSLTLPVTSAWS